MPNGDYSKHLTSVFTSKLYFIPPNDPNPCNFSDALFSDRDRIQKTNKKTLARHSGRQRACKLGLPVLAYPSCELVLVVVGTSKAVDERSNSRRAGEKDTSLLRLLTHFSQLCSSTLLLPQRMRACSQARFDQGKKCSRLLF